MDRDALTILQFTDTHLVAEVGGRLYGVNTYETLADTISAALATNGMPDCVLLTGDISQDETAASYDNVRQITGTIATEVYFLPGNHDRFDVMSERLANGSTNIKHERSFVKKGWQVILLDSTIEKKVEGNLREGELERLEKLLSENASLHTLVCLHHNPVGVGSDIFDGIGLLNARDFFSVLDKHNNVRGILWGHVHQEFSSDRNGVALMATPSTCFQFKPRVNFFALDELPPGYRHITLHADGRIESRVYRLPSMPEGIILAAKTS